MIVPSLCPPFIHYITVPSSAPLNMTVEEVGSTYALLHWSPPVQVDQNGIIQHYIVHLKSLKFDEGLNVNLTTNRAVTDILIDFLQANTEYLCSVAAVTLSPGPPSVTVNLITDTAGT